MKNSKRSVSAALGIALGFALLATPIRIHAENWPQWRGVTGQGISSEKGIPTEWNTEKNVLWKTLISGEGHSSPIIWENRVFLTTAAEDGHDRMLLCLDAGSGKILWQKVAVTSEDLEPLHAQNDYASTAPATDGKAVFTSFYGNGYMNVSAFDFDGNPLWAAKPLKFKAEHGYNHMPFLHGDKLFFSVDQWEEPAIIALDKNTGKTAWRFNTEKDFCSNVPPIVAKTGGRTQLLTSGNSMTRGFDPETGKLLWSCQGPTKYCVAGMTVADDLVIATGGYPERRIIAVRTNGNGDVTKKNIAWELQKGTTYVPSPVCVGGHLYSITDNGVGYCYDAKTGKTAWQKRLPGNYRSSLTLTEGNIYVTNDEGVTTIFKAKPDSYQEVAANSLNEFTYASPVISGGRLFLRTKTTLYCIGKK